MRVAVTGHRKNRLNNKEKDVQYWVTGQIKNLIGCYDNIELISGMAQGVDQIAAVAAIMTGVPVYCYFPYKHKLSNTEKNIVNNAAEVRYEAEKFQPDVFIRRDRRMVDDCDLLIVVWDGKPWGGTYETYKYALECGKDILLFPWETI